MKHNQTLIFITMQTCDTRLLYYDVHGWCEMCRWRSVCCERYPGSIPSTGLYFFPLFSRWRGIRKEGCSSPLTCGWSPPLPLYTRWEVHSRRRWWWYLRSICVCLAVDLSLSSPSPSLLSHTHTHHTHATRTTQQTTLPTAYDQRSFGLVNLNLRPVAGC